MKFTDKVFISILDIDILHLKENLDVFKLAGINNIHIDVIDTSFCKNISFGPTLINSILDLGYNVHVNIMIGNPMDIIRSIHLECKNLRMITVHSHYIDVRDYLEDKNHIGLGIAICPDQNNTLDIMKITPDHVLIMTVNPGYGGQAMNTECLRKIEFIKSRSIRTGVDGGVNARNIHLLKDFDFIVIGSELTKSKDFNETLTNLKIRYDKTEY